MFEGIGFFGLLVLVADIWAIINVAQAKVDNVKKLFWILLVLFLPLLGVIIWFFAGPRAPKTA